MDRAVQTLTDVVRRYRDRSVEIRRPIVLVVEDLPIMGATESRASGHRLHVGAHVIESGMLDGLLAHEIGHMVRTEQGHPSHRANLHQRLLESFQVPADQRNGFAAAAGTAINHVQDVYADDLAIEVIGRDRIGPFFSDWITRSAVRGRRRWATLVNEVTVAFALGNMKRHGVPPADGAEDRATAFASSAGLRLLTPMVSSFAGLPATDHAQTVESAMRALLSYVHAEGVPRPVLV